MAKKKPAKKCSDWRNCAIAILVLILFVGTVKMVEYMNDPDNYLPVHECLSSAECQTGHICYCYKFCSDPTDPTSCSPVQGDLKCHKTCASDIDCLSGELCDNRMIWIGDTGTGIKMCFSKNETCQGYCQGQVHVMCVGNWNISGDYPNCDCQFICTFDMNCPAYCEKHYVHIMCVGQWSISGVYPDCLCQWLCEEGGPV